MITYMTYSCGYDLLTQGWTGRQYCRFTAAGIAIFDAQPQIYQLVSCDHVRRTLIGTVCDSDYITCAVSQQLKGKLYCTILMFGDAYMIR